MTLAKGQITDSRISIGLSNFRITVEHLLKLLDLEQEDEYGILRPTEYAFKTAMKLTVETYDILGDNFPKPSTGTHEGSVRLAWQNVKADRRVRLFCPHNADEKAYIYHQKSEEYGSEDITSAETLAHWLEWFNNV
jgi:hypothetical protein